MSLMTVKNLSVWRGNRPVVDRASFSIGRAELVGLIGPNGAGKTSLLRASLGLLEHVGHSSLDDLRASERARAVAFMPQGREIAWPIKVEDLVNLGRGPHAGDGRAAVEAAIDLLNLGRLRARRATELSGGEQARALIARALAQETPLLIADEPAAGLDPNGQIEIMELFRKLALNEGRSTLVSIHDLSMAARYCTRLILMDQGRIIADGEPCRVLTDRLVAAVFGVRAYRAETRDGMIFQPLSRID